MPRNLVIAILISLGALPVLAGAGRPCTKAQAIAAESEAGALKSWAALRESFRRYGHCDDGAIGEGYSESITRLLAEQWDTFPALAALVEKDPTFEHFVVGHIDATVPAQRLATIRENAKQRCPRLHARLCQRLSGHAEH